MIARIGEDFGDGVANQAADRLERSLVRLYNEPLEFDCPLFYDDDVARAHGYRGIIAPYSGLAAWTSVGVWNYGDDPVYISAERNFQPHPRTSVLPRNLPIAFNAGFGTEIEYEYHEPFVVGDWLSIRGKVLVSVTPRQTRVGRGAFTVWQSEVTNQAGNHIATSRLGLYLYVVGEFATSQES